MSAAPPTVSAATILTGVGKVSVNPDAPAQPPEVIPAAKVQSVMEGRIRVGEFTPKDRAQAAINLAWFVGSLITLVILFVFIDYLGHIPSTPESQVSRQPSQQESPAPITPTPTGSASPQATSPAQQTSFVQETVFLQNQNSQASPAPTASPKNTGSPQSAKTGSTEATTPPQATSPKTPEESFALISNAVVDRASKMFDVIVSKALLPIFTALLGYIFGTQPSRSNT